MAFFVLSGFLISSSVLRKVQCSRWSWRDYAIDRGVRLYLVLAPCLVLGGVLDLAGFHFFNQNAIYSDPLPAFGDAVPIQHLNLLSFAGSLLFAQTRFTTVFGSNGPLWSLFNEFWYYVTFPALVWIVLSLKRRSFMAIVYLFMAGIAAWVLGGRDLWIRRVARWGMRLSYLQKISVKRNSPLVSCNLCGRIPAPNRRLSLECPHESRAARF